MEIQQLVPERKKTENGGNEIIKEIVQRQFSLFLKICLHVERH